MLKQGLNGGHVNSINALRREIDNLCARPTRLGGIAIERFSGKKSKSLEMNFLENVPAIHRLEILTLAERNELLNDFGKALLPLGPERTGILPSLKVLVSE